MLRLKAVRIPEDCRRLAGDVIPGKWTDRIMRPGRGTGKPPVAFPKAFLKHEQTLW
jgi:hypothetical protein